MKKIIVPLVLVLLIVLGIVVYFIWQNSNKNATNNGQELSGITPTNSTSQTGTLVLDSDTSTSDVCNLLTLDIAKEILGSDTKLDSQNKGNCTYTSISVDSSSFGILTMIVTKSGAITARSQFEDAKVLAYSNQIEAVSGLNADDAYYASTLKQLSILKGDSWIIISGLSDKFPDEKELAIATANLVLK